MKHKILPFLFLALLLNTILCLPRETACEEPKRFVPDKALCAKMLAFGEQAYQRGKYLDAKGYFRRAILADPSSTLAWRYYDMAIVFGLAEKVEKNANLTAPDVSVRGETGYGKTVPPAPPPPRAGPAQKQKVEEKEEEGC
jgi:hypothetical protein